MYFDKYTEMGKNNRNRDIFDKLFYIYVYVNSIVYFN